MFVSFIFGALALLVPGMLMRIYTGDAELIALGIRYLKVVSLSYVFFGISSVYLTIMKSSSKTTLSTVYGSTAVVSNLILNYPLIFGIGIFPRMEIERAALATVIARGMELIFILLKNLKKDVVKIRIKSILIPDQILKRDCIRFCVSQTGSLIVNLHHTMMLSQLYISDIISPNHILKE